MKRSILNRILLLSLTVSAHAATRKSSPNVIVILSDELGWGDVSCNQPERGKVSTPAIDALAKGGMRFTNAHAAHSVCTPTRTTLGSMFRSRGYATAAFGKWHLGLGWKPIAGDPGDFHYGSHLHGPGGGAAIAAVGRRVDHDAPISGGPNELGFDEFFGTPSNCSRIPVFVRNDRVINNPQRDKKGLMTDPAVDRKTVDDLYVAETEKFIRAATQDNKPFFVYLALNAAHGAILPPDRYEGKSGIGPRGDRCLWVDESVAKIRKLLEDTKLLNNTLILFTSDNGPKYTKKEISQHDHDGSGPYRGFKTDIWDGGTRVPFIAHWPGQIKAGTENDNLVCLTDVLPTLASLVDAKLPTWAAEDGVDQHAQLLDPQATPTRKSMITQSYVGILSIREGDWKLIFDTQGSGGFYRYSAEAAPMQTLAPWRVDFSQSGQLYNLSSDPYEQTNLYDQHPETVQRLTKKMRAAIVNGRSDAD